MEKFPPFSCTTSTMWSTWGLGLVEGMLISNLTKLELGLISDLFNPFEFLISQSSNLNGQTSETTSHLVIYLLTLILNVFAVPNQFCMYNRDACCIAGQSHRQGESHGLSTLGQGSIACMHIQQQPCTTAERCACINLNVLPTA